MLIADLPDAHQRVVMLGRAQLTAKYIIEITLYDFDGVYPIEIIWDPHLPPPAKQKKLAKAVSAALDPYYAKALHLNGLLKENQV